MLISVSRGPYPRLRLVLIGIGLLVVLVGAADALSRLSQAALGEDAAKKIFAPAVVQGSTAPSAAFVPARLAIASIGVDAPVIPVGKRADGSMESPKKFGDIGWYSPGPKPGEAGNAVFAGHVNNALSTSGVFEHLSQVHIGDYVAVSDASGKTLLYRISEINQYPADEAPIASIFATEGPSQLVLYTCDGEWVPSERSFSKRLVVVAKKI